MIESQRRGSGYQMGLAKDIKTLEFVDDIADVNQNFSFLCHSNKLIENIQHEKVLNFSSKRCKLLKVGPKSSNGFIYVNNKSITYSER